MQNKQAFIDIRLRPGHTREVLMTSSCSDPPRNPIWPITAKRDVIHETGST